jgi:hypothetical protein
MKSGVRISVTETKARALEAQMTQEMLESIALVRMGGDPYYDAGFVGLLAHTFFSGTAGSS